MFNQAQYRKRFEVEKLEGSVKKTIYRYQPRKNELTGKVTQQRVEEITEVPAGFMVYTAKGGSIHFYTRKALVAAGFGNESETVDMNSGDVIQIREHSLKEIAQANEVRKQISRPTSSASDANQLNFE